MQIDSQALKKRRRPPVQRERVVQGLVRMIVSGELATGTQLPAQTELMRRFKVETQTISDAMEVLSTDGFIETLHRRGRFVVMHPPHLTHYALTFPFSADQLHSQFYLALRAEAERQQSPDCRFSLFYDIQVRHDLPDYQRLLELIRRHALAGVIYAARPWGLWNDPILTEPGVPRVAIAAGPHEPGVPTVSPDGAAFLPRACAWLAGRGCRKVAILMLANEAKTTTENGVREVITRHGLDTQQRWLQAVAAPQADWAANMTAAMVHGAMDDRPDALIVTDDNLVPAATAGVATAGRRVAAPGEPRRTGDLDVVAHANFPHVTPSAVPAQRLGFDARQVLTVAMDRLHQLRRGEDTPATTWVPLMDEQAYAVARGAAKKQAMNAN